ncbi:MAG: methionine biosynthesis protein MetW, partial [Planctomycetaceae bacterium]
GRTPVTQSLPYSWYNTPNLHFMSMADFRELAGRLNVKIVHEIPIIAGRSRRRAWLPNVRAESLFYILERGDTDGSAESA